MNAPLNESVYETENASPNVSVNTSPSTSANASPDASGDASVNVSVNGEARVLSGPVSLAALVATLTRAASGVAAAVNETVVPRGEWETTVLGEGDRVEVLTAVQGG